ncbi:MAG: hypothetical protein Q8O72_08805 [Bacteroidales bacterium]|nr:hypothetical protein [Bacteroidales bacterium]
MTDIVTRDFNPGHYRIAICLNNEMNSIVTMSNVGRADGTLTLIHHNAGGMTDIVTRDFNPGH